MFYSSNMTSSIIAEATRNNKDFGIQKVAEKLSSELEHFSFGDLTSSYCTPNDVSLSSQIFEKNYANLESWTCFMKRLFVVIRILKESQTSRYRRCYFRYFITFSTMELSKLHCMLLLVKLCTQWRLLLFVKMSCCVNKILYVYLYIYRFLNMKSLYLLNY